MLGLMKGLARRKFDPATEHDCHEFLIYLLSNLQDELTPKNSRFDSSVSKTNEEAWCAYKTAYPSIVDSLFTGLLKKSVKCEKCK